MADKLVYGYDYNGFYAGQTIAQEDPRKAGSFLMPANSTDKIPPEPSPGLRAKWNGSEWALADISLIIYQNNVAPIEENADTYGELLENRIIDLEAENVALKDTVDTLLLSML